MYIIISTTAVVQALVLVRSWMSRCQIYRHWRQRSLSLLLPAMPPRMTKLVVSWQLSAFSGRNPVIRRCAVTRLLKLLHEVATYYVYHYNDVIMGAIASQITTLTVVYSIVYSDADQRKHQSSASLAFVRGIHRGPVIPRTNRQLRGKCFHLMTSSCGALTRSVHIYVRCHLAHIRSFHAYGSVVAAGLLDPWGC